MAELTEEQKKALENFDPKKPLVVNCAEIDAFKDIVGRFVCKRPTVQDRINIGIAAAKERGGSDKLDNFLENLIYILNTLEVVVTEKPAGVVFRELNDFDGIFELYGRYDRWLECFRLSVQRSEGDAGVSSK